MTRILIVDDEEIARLTLAEILRLEGYDIQAVENGEAAVEVLRSQPFDVMVLDLKMPGIGGIEVLEQVVDTLPGLKVIVLTAYGTMDSAIQAIRYRVHDYLLKPAAPERVLEAISSALANRQFDSDVVNGAPGRGKNELLPGGVEISWDRRLVIWQGGSLSLTPTEARLLKTLLDRKNEMIPHSELVFIIQGYQIDTEEAAKILRPVVSRLRQKMIDVPGLSDRIINVRGAGYVLDLN